MNLQPRRGYCVLVSDTDENRSNTYWSEYIGLKGTILRVGPDGLLDVSIQRKDGYPSTPTGVSPSRFFIWRKKSWWEWVFSQGTIHDR